MMGKSVYSVVVGLLLPIQCLAANVDVTVNPSDSMLAPGGSAFVDLIGNYDGFDKLLGGAITLKFRSDILEVLGVTLTAPQDVAGSTGIVSTNGTNGAISGIGFATFAGVTGPFELATIEFRSVGPIGTSPITLSDAADPIFAWVNESFDPISVSVNSGTVAVVPEPGTWAMMLAGLGVLAGGVSRRQSGPSAIGRKFSSQFLR